MISVLVFSILIVALLDVFSKSQLMSKREESVYTAYSLAKNHIEMLKSISFSDLSVAEETLTAVDGTGEPEPSGLYRRTTDITTSYTGDADLTQITVEVYYTIRGALSDNPMEMTTVVYNG
jgi:type II secretory pathway pseudopilin PulG